MAPPGIPNMTSTPSASSERTRDWAPVTGSAVTAFGAAGAFAGVGWGFTPAATVSGDGVRAGFGFSGGDLVMASMPSSGFPAYVPERSQQKSPRARHVGSRVGLCESDALSEKYS